jgi:hypothetical protein
MKKKPIQKSNSLPLNEEELKKAAVENEIWFDKQQVLQFTNISSRTLQTWRTDKLLPYARIRNKIYYRKSDIQMLLLKNLQ